MSWTSLAWMLFGASLAGLWAYVVGYRTGRKDAAGAADHELKVRAGVIDLRNPWPWEAPHAAGCACPRCRGAE